MPSPGVRECSYEPGNALVTFEGFKVWGGQIPLDQRLPHDPPPGDQPRLAIGRSH